MSAYLIAEVDVTDAKPYEDYRAQVPASIEPFGGRFIVRGGASALLEGDDAPSRIVVIEFPSMSALRAWYDSPTYAPLIELRQRASKARLIAVEGV